MNNEDHVRRVCPQPIDISDIHLEDYLRDITEVLAENVHETWRAQRISEGWRYGEKRDDTAKLHPGLVPYSELSENEKEYDRLTAINTLKLTVKLGYIISRREE